MCPLALVGAELEVNIALLVCVATVWLCVLSVSRAR